MGEPPELVDRLTQLADDGRDLTGVASGVRQLDELTAGFQDSNLVVLAARPGMGKTSLALNIAAHVGVRERTPVAIFSLEMSREEVTTRLMCAEGKVDSKRLRRGKLDASDWEKLTNASSKLYDAPIYIDDTAGVTPIEIKAKSRRLKSRLKGELGLVIVDYLQLMGGQTRVENRVQEISQISRALKLIARDLDVPVLAISQLSRAVEQRTDKRPVLSDLRESGSIEQDADLVMFVYRDDYYDDSSDDKGTAELILAKHRNGPIDKIRLAYIGRYTKFDNLARGGEQQVQPDAADGRRWGAMGRRGQGQGRRPPRRARRRGRPLPGRKQRRPHARDRRRDVHAPARPERHPLPRNALPARERLRDRSRGADRGARRADRPGHRRRRPAHLGQRPPDHALAPDHRRRLRAGARAAPDRDDPSRNRPGVRRQGAARRHPRAGPARREDPSAQDPDRALGQERAPAKAPPPPAARQGGAHRRDAGLRRAH